MNAASLAAASAGTLLFVPGDRPERFGKAAAAGADLVVLDLEDAVAPENKEAARANVAAWAAEHVCAVRVNAADTSSDLPWAPSTWPRSSASIRWTARRSPPPSTPRAWRRSTVRWWTSRSSNAPNAFLSRAGE
ncbi:aldolase/citrate lyase family protein [Gordonia iterans]